MKKFALILLVSVFSAAVLYAEWWDEGKYDWTKAQKLDDGILFGNFKKLFATFIKKGKNLTGALVDFLCRQVVRVL